MYFNLYFIVKGTWRSCLCGTYPYIWFRKRKVTEKHQYHPHTRHRSIQPEAHSLSLSPSFSTTQKFSQMKSKAFPPGKPNKSHVSWTLFMSRQAQGVCQSKQVPESKDFRWELSATSPPQAGPALPSQLLLLEARHRGLPSQWHIWQLCQERLGRRQRKKQCAFLKKPDTLGRNTWNTPSSKPEWLSAHTEKHLGCCPEGELRKGSTRFLPLQNLPCPCSVTFKVPALKSGHPFLCLGSLGGHPWLLNFSLIPCICLCPSQPCFSALLFNTGLSLGLLIT